MRASPTARRCRIVALPFITRAAPRRRAARSASSSATCSRTSPAPLLVVATLEFGLMVLFEAGLSFLGLGIQPPTPSWGSILAVGRNYMATRLVDRHLPGLCLFLLVLSVNVLRRPAPRPPRSRARRRAMSRGERVPASRGERVVVTGAGGVFGRWIAAAFARAGARLCLSDPRAEVLDRLPGELGLARKTTLLHATELRETRRSVDLVRLVERALGRARHPVNNAGVYPRGHLLDIDPAENGTGSWTSTCGRPFLLTREMARLMIARGRPGLHRQHLVGRGAAACGRLGALQHVEDGARAADRGLRARAGAAPDPGQRGVAGIRAREHR